jgi:hypothetical protein
MDRAMTRWTDEQLDAYLARSGFTDAVGGPGCRATIKTISAAAAHVVKQRATPAPLERDVLPAVLEALRLHPRVAWCHRFNTGAMEVDGRNVRFAFAGCSDILGQLKDGRFLAVEVKRPSGMPTTAQVEFLGLVERSGGVAFVARGADDVFAVLNDLPKRAA